MTQHELSTIVNSVIINQETDLDKRVTKALLWKIDLRLIPLLKVVYFVSFLVRIHIGHVIPSQLESDLVLSATEKMWSGLLFFISYILFGIPSVFLMRKWSPSKWISCLVLTSGIIIISMFFVKNLAGLLITRFLLGMAEAGIVAAVTFYLSLWYIRKDQAFRVGIFVSGAVLADIFSEILINAIENLDKKGGLSKWQWTCLVEGVPTICLAAVIYKFLADPTTVKWLDQCNKDILTARLQADGNIIDNDNSLSSYDQIRSVFFDWKVLFYIFMYMGAATSVYSQGFLLPDIIKDMGYKNLTAGLLNIPPYFVSYVVIIFSSWNAGRLNERSTHLMILLFIQICGFIYLILSAKDSYVGTIIIGTGVFSTNALMLSWVTNNIQGQTKRAFVTGLVIAFGNIGLTLGEQIYIETDTISSRRRHYFIIGTLSFTFILVLGLKLLLKYENRRHRNLLNLHCQDESQVLSKKHRDFIYVT